MFRRFKVAARRNVRAAACFYADVNAPAGSQRQQMLFFVTTLSGENVNFISAIYAQSNAEGILDNKASCDAVHCGQRVLR